MLSAGTFVVGTGLSSLTWWKGRGPEGKGIVYAVDLRGWDCCVQIAKLERFQTRWNADPLGGWVTWTDVGREPSQWETSTRAETENKVSREKERENVRDADWDSM